MKHSGVVFNLYQRNDSSLQGTNGYFYYCKLCDEALVLSPQRIHPKKILLAFSKTCPGCGFELRELLSCEELVVPIGAEMYTNPRCSDPESLLNLQKPFEVRLVKGGSLAHRFEPDFTTGINQVDEGLVLKQGHLAVLQGKLAQQVFLLLCARTISSLESKSGIVVIDGGNSFDTYGLLQYCSSLGLDEEFVRKKVHLSRAFTHHQLASLVSEKLPLAIDQESARLACVSDITLLYSDPDVRDKAEALRIFRDSLKSLKALAEQRNALIIVTNLESRNRKMDSALLESAQIYAKLEDRRGTLQLKVTKHPFMAPPAEAKFSEPISEELLASRANGLLSYFSRND